MPAYPPGAVIVYGVDIRRSFLGGWLLCMLCTAADAVDRVEIRLGDMQGAGWQARALTLWVNLGPGAELSGEVSLDELVLPAPLGPVGAVRVQCATLTHDVRGTRCQGRVEVAQLLGEALAGTARIEYAAADGGVTVALQDVRRAGGRWRLDAESRAGRWQFTAQALQVDLAAARELLRQFVPAFGYTLTGRADLEARVQGDAAGPDAVRLTFNTTELDFANESGTQAGERLALDFTAEGRRRGADWQGDARIALGRGALFIDPVYLEPTPQSPVRLTTTLHWSAASRRLHLTDLVLDHPGVAQARAELRLRLGDTTTLESVEAQLDEAHLPGAYLSYIQPWLHGGVGDALETAGRFSGSYRYHAGGDTALRLRVQDVDIADTGQRFGVNHLNGVIDWASDAVPRTSELAWQGGSLYRLGIGAAQLAVVSRGLQFELREPTRIPVLDGALLIDDLALSDPGAETQRWRFDGVLTPVSMEAVAAALGWPDFGGQLSGMIPSVQFADGVLEVGGVLLARAFDGEVTVRNLRLEQPFGAVPRLWADIAVDNLDLEALTGTFEFGRITGRLGGHVKGLQMAAWQPVAFDARLATPEGDRSRHRISQKAVDNLSSIGGGVGGALSRTFLGMFEDFPYDRLGLSCVLENGVCRMNGVAPAQQGYYIVKGRFLPPRINVVGYSDRVDWKTLIGRLKSVTLDQAPVLR
ncbi:MAG: hypothetical protein ABR553_01950 [Gammaproteobacteria bacterium]